MTEALVAAVFHLHKPNLMREKRICTGLPLYASEISVQWNGASVLVLCAALEARRFLDCVFCSPMYHYVLAGARTCRT